MRTVLQLTRIDETGDSYYRMRWPAEEVARQRPDWRVINLDARAAERYEWAASADLLVLYQSGDTDLLPIVRARSSRGLRTLVEYNDNFYEPPHASPVAKDWRSPLLWQIYERFMRLADGVLVTGQGLKRLFSTRIPGLTPVILENHFPAEPEPFSELWNEDYSTIRLGWAGSLGHISDFLAVLPILKQLIEQHPTLQLHVMGNESIPSFVRLPENRFRFTHWGSVHQYYEFLRTLHIGIAPLLETPYNECRSDVKAIELSAHGVCPVLSNSLPYQEFFAKVGTEGVRGLDSFRERIGAVVSSPAAARQIAERCHNYVVAERTAIRRTERTDLYESMMPAAPDTGRLIGAPETPGYHEIEGRSDPQLRSAVTLQRAQAALQNKQLDQAGQLFEAAHSENPDAPDVAYGWLKISAHQKGAAAVELAKKLIAEFPSDLRFRLIQARIVAGPSRPAVWQEIVGLLQAQSSEYRRFFRSNVITAVSAQLRSDPQLLGVARALLAFFPESLQLRFALGEVLEVRGETAEAAVHFAAVRDGVRLRGLNEKFLAEVEEGYVSAWAEALEARIRKA